MTSDGRPGDLSIEYLDVGRIVAPFGLAGEVRVVPLTDFPERLASLRQVLVGDDRRVFRVQRTRQARGQLLLKLRGVDGPEAAEALRGNVVRIPLSEAAPLADGQYFWYQIIDLEVVTVGGDLLGTVVDIIRTGANDVYVVRGGRGDVLIPAIEDVVREVDLAGRRIVIDPLPGLLD